MAAMAGGGEAAAAAGGAGAGAAAGGGAGGLAAGFGAGGWRPPAARGGRRRGGRRRGGRSHRRDGPRRRRRGGGGLPFLNASFIAFFFASSGSPSSGATATAPAYTASMPCTSPAAAPSRELPAPVRELKLLVGNPVDRAAVEAVAEAAAADTAVGARARTTTLPLEVLTAGVDPAEALRRRGEAAARAAASRHT